MPSRAIQIERMVKRVDNAIHNPAIDFKGVKAALADLKAAGITPYNQEYDHWIRLAIDSRNEIKLRCLFGSIKTTTLAHLLEKKSSYIPLYMNSPLFNPNNESHYNDIIDFGIKNDYTYGEKMILFFQHPRSWTVLQKLISHRKYFRRYLSVNPIAKKRKHLNKVLLRFWLLTTKPLLRAWRESLYFPGTGALYKKAAASFKAD